MYSQPLLGSIGKGKTLLPSLYLLFVPRPTVVYQTIKRKLLLSLCMERSNFIKQPSSFDDHGCRSVCAVQNSPIETNNQISTASRISRPSCCIIPVSTGLFRPTNYVSQPSVLSSMASRCRRWSLSRLSMACLESLLATSNCQVMILLVVSQSPQIAGFLRLRE